MRASFHHGAAAARASLARTPPGAREKFPERRRQYPRFGGGGGARGAAWHSHRRGETRDLVSHASRAAFHDGESVPALRAGARLWRHRVARGVPRVRRRQGEAPGHGGAGAPDGVGRSSRGGGAQSRPSPRESGATPAVTCIARAPGSSLVAAGAADGSVRLFNLDDGSSDVLLKGHRSEVTALRFNADGSLLVSGGKDTNVVVWDVVAEAGLCRLRGHKDQVTDAVFVPSARGGARRRGATRHVQQGRHRSRVGPRHATLRADGRRARCRVLVPRPRPRRSTTRRRDERRRLHVFAVAGDTSTTVSTRTPTPLPAPIPIPTRRRRRRRGDRSRM